MATRVRLVPGLGPGQEKVERPGYDGLKVERYIHWLDGEGDTRTASLGVDRYRMIPEILLKGPAGDASAAATPVSPEAQDARP